MKTFLSWDCANKTLAHAHITVDTAIVSKIAGFVNEMSRWNEQSDPEGLSLRDLLSRFNYALCNFITFHSTAVSDILQGRKVENVGEIERSAALVKFLAESPVAVGNLDPATVVMIEHQPSKIGDRSMNKSPMIGYQLMFYYSGFHTILVEPKIKNKLSVAGHTLDKYTGAHSPYYARKKHSKEIFLHLVKTFGWENAIKGVKMSCMDDLADAVLQVIAFMKKV